MISILSSHLIPKELGRINIHQDLDIPAILKANPYKLAATSQHNFWGMQALSMNRGRLLVLNECEIIKKGFRLVLALYRAVDGPLFSQLWLVVRLLLLVVHCPTPSNLCLARFGITLEI